MTTLFEPAYAKVNLTLDVLGKREDGYHDLQSVMQTISLRDDIEIDIGTGRPWCLKCDNEEIPTNEKNLAWKAAKVFFDAVKKDPDGLEIRITKRIPCEAGLGGGSADAAIGFMKEYGCTNIKLMVLLAAPEGIARIQADHPDVHIYCGALDEKLNERGYIVPGLGDAGDRIFGTK